MSEHMDRIDNFAQQVIKEKFCYVLSNDSGLLITPSQFEEQLDVLPIWSDFKSAQKQIKGRWQPFSTVKLELDELIELLPLIQDDGLLTGLDLTDEQIATELKPKDLLAALKA